MANSISKIASPAIQESAKESAAKYAQPLEFASLPRRDETPPVEGVFHSLLTYERRRAERSRKPFVLMLLDANLEDGTAAKILKRAVDVVLATKRETDLVGWYKQGVILGVIFTEVSMEGQPSITEVLRTKVETALIKHLGKESAAKIAVSLHLFPESWDKDQAGWIADSKLYPDLKKRVSRKRSPLAIKRAMDIAGS